MADGPGFPKFDRKMSDAEGLMWRLEKDPHLSSTFANVTILDRSPDFERLVARMERATHVVERLRQRVQPMPVNLTAPMWVDDTNFDIRYHVRHVALPKPGSMRQLLDLASLITCDPFERTRPLWQFVVVDGLRGGRSALIEKLHHTIADGETSVQMSLQFLDFERDAPEPPPIDPASFERPEEPTSAQANQDLLRDMVAGSLRLPLGLIRQIKDLLADPTGIPDAGNAAADTIRGVMSQLNDTEQAHSPLWTSRSLQRGMEVLRAPFDETKAAAKKLGGTLNTAFLTAAAEAAGNYHRELGSPVDELRASMAISTRTDDSGSNAFSLARMMVPTGDMPIADRFQAIQASTGAAREASAGGSLEALAAVAASLPTSLVTRLARQQAQTVDFATSNVRGAPMPMFVAGAQLLENYPVGPLGGVAFNLTLLSYNHSLDMGINLDRAAVTEPDLLRRCMERAFGDLLAV
ncbi:MAG: WS/DGAT domain-containing protein [Actinobacteria bacterium]|nr:WS/DGAT domain-containing protein [Actinomycetota bacterium]